MYKLCILNFEKLCLFHIYFILFWHFCWLGWHGYGHFPSDKTIHIAFIIIDSYRHTVVMISPKATITLNKILVEVGQGWSNQY